MHGSSSTDGTRPSSTQLSRKFGNPHGNVVAWDTETAPFRPGRQVPPLACVTWQRPGVEPRIVAAADALPTLRSWLEDPDVLLVGAHVAYDFAVVCEQFPQLRPLVFAAYAADRVTDVLLRQRLIDIGEGVYKGHWDQNDVFEKHIYDLESLTRRVAGIRLQKDAWRRSYGEFIGVPLSRWPERALEVQAKGRVQLTALQAKWAGIKSLPKEVLKTLEGLRDMVAGDPSRCVEYPLDDARATLAVWQAQEAFAKYLPDQYRKARAYFALYLSSVWGLRTSPDGVEILRTETTAAYKDLEDWLGNFIDSGSIRDRLVRDDEARSRNTKFAKTLMVDICKRDGLRLRRTEGHSDPFTTKCRDVEGQRLTAGHDDCVEHVSLDAEACQATDDEHLVSYAEISTLKKVLANDIEALSKGTLYPLHTRYGLAESGRTTSSNPPIQNLCKRPGIREAFVPRAGRLFAQADYPTLELYALAQCCVSWLGESKLAEALNAGLDAHLWFASLMLGIPYADAEANKKRPDVKKARQLAKAANFGFPGGMGPAKLVAATRKATPRDEFRALGLDEKRARKLKTEWLEAWPEMEKYFELADRKYRSGEPCETLFTQRFRGGASYCAICNNGFQALGADCATNAAWLIARAEYIDTKSPLFNARTVAFVHDEFIVEVDDGPGAHEAAYELAKIMVEGANQYLPDVPIPLSKLDPLLMRRWSKAAEPCFGSDGRLVPWT